MEAQCRFEPGQTGKSVNLESLNLLEYEALRALIRRYAGSEAGRRVVDAVVPGIDRAVLEAAHAETSEALEFLAEAQAPSPRGGAAASPALRFSGLPDIEPSTAKLRIQGTVLEALEIAAIAALLERAAEIRQTLAPQAGRYPRLAAHAAGIGDFRGVLKAIDGKILPDGSLGDHASVALARIRRDLERQKRHIHESLERFLKQHRDDGLLQDEFVTIRNDRFVVPVVPSAKRKAPGVVHAASGSGQTLFIEPLETIELNNDLVRLADEELREIHRILAEMTSRLREHAAEIRETSGALAALDAIFARAHFAAETNAVVPRFASDEAPRLNLKDARHPLLDDLFRRQRKRVVPFTLTLDGALRTLLISGPNTGGKTVTMKTVGAFALMAQSGWPVPAAEAELPVFADVLADIGDNQSIEHSLSSFSAHVARIREMVEASQSGALVLLDELGRATDPDEGGALGVAILDEFRRGGCYTLASTHLLAIKVYGANTEGVLNASMGYDDETLAPTYILRTGAPGKSAGLDIAAKLGLPARLIERARAAMSSTGRDISRFLNELEAAVQEARAEADSLRRRQADLDERERVLEKEMARREAARLREIEEQAEQAQKRFDQEARATIERVLSAPEQRKQAERALRQVATTKRELKEAVQTVARGERPAVQAAPEQIQPGARVRLRDVGQPAKVLKKLGADRLEVEVGLLKMQIPLSEVLEVLPASQSAPSRLPSGVTFTGAGPRWDTLTREINVIGKTSLDAEEEVERFLDAAVLGEVTRVRIVHGHGMGVLKRMVQELLAKHPAVEKHYPASPAEGGNGATIAELKAG
ncbi:MAG: Smr/MutS family protein [Bryobacteraceae bacterium]|nr:Smr/MutS family protein [Bryobacteraceae bacterium]